MTEKRAYATPVFEEEDGMVFPEELWEGFSNRPWCFGCTNCNCSCY